MKISHLIAIYLLLNSQISQADSKKAAPLKAAYTATHIAGNTHVIYGDEGEPNPQNQGFMNNPGIVVTNKGMVIIDPGSSVQTGDMVVAQAQIISDLPIVAVFSTHVHGDHWLGNQAIKQAYPNATFYGHPDLIKQANEGEAERWLGIMLDLTEGATAGTVAVIPEQPVNHGDEIKIGDKTFKAIHLEQAHTLTDIMLHVLEDDVYFLGDNSFNHRVGRFDDGSYTGLADTLKLASEAMAKHYIPGHGPAGDIGVVSQYAEFMARIYRGVEKYYEEGLSDYEMKPMIVETLKPWQHWEGFEASVGRFISLAFLEVEKHEFE